MLKVLLQLALFVTVKGFQIESKLLKKVERSYAGFPKPPNESLKIDFNADIVRVINVDESEQNVELYVSISQRWNISDTPLWTPYQYGNFQYIKRKPGELWQPDIVAYHSLDAKGGAHSPLSEACSYITLYSNGTVVCHGYTVIMIFCNIGLSRFPSDSYNCRLCFGSRNYEKNEINLDWWDARIYKTINKIKPDAREWEVMVNVDYENSSQCNNVDQLDTSKIVIKMTITRKAIAYHLTLFVPCLFLSVIMFLAFIVPTETGQRLSLIVTVLLTITVFQQFTLDILPPYSLPVLSRYYLFSLLLAFVSTVIDIVLLNTYTRSRRNLPELVHTVFIEWIGSLIYMTRNYYNYETGKYDIRHQDVKNALEQEIDIPKSKTAGAGHTIYSISFEGKSHWNSLPRPTDYLRKRNKKLTIDALAEEKERKQREKITELEKTVLHDYKETEKRITEEVNRHQIFRLVRVLDRLFLFTSVFAVLVYSIYYLLRVLL